MNEVTFQEPPTSGMVEFLTNRGNFLVELWSRECPKACRNFIQNCLEGYYNGTIFHRIIPDFLIQTGDPTGSGLTCESVYGEPFPDEFHTRLKYRYRGLLGVANGGKGTNTNGSQFFITLSKQEFLNGQNTLFGRIVGNTIFTLVRISESEVDKEDRPIGDDVPIIMETRVKENPFPDIIPRYHKPPFEVDKSKDETVFSKKEKIIGKRTGVLSFNDEEDEIQPSRAMKSAHDALRDKSLSQTRVLVRDVDVPARPHKALQSVSGQNNAISVEESESGPVEQPKSSASVLNEIEKLKNALKKPPAWAVEKSEPQETGKSGVGKKRSLDISERMKEWTQSISKFSKPSSPHSDSRATHQTRKTLYSLISSAEMGSEPSDMKSGSWLKNTGSIKFAIDSRNAFSNQRYLFSTCVCPPTPLADNFPQIEDSFELEQGSLPFLFFLIAMVLGFAFVFPLLHVPPAGVIPSLVPPQAVSIVRRISGKRRRGFPPPLAPGYWPTLGRLRHPVSYFLGDSPAVSSADSEEFDRILDEESAGSDSEVRQRIFGKPRLRPRSHVV
jgi:cyclophilin family peptidyl-prolyl cis-trans isomerase